MSKYSVKRGEDNAYQVVDDALYETLKANFTNPKCFAIETIAGDLENLPELGFERLLELHKIFLDAQKIATSASSRSAYSPQDVNYEFIKALVATAVAQVAQIEVRTIHSKITIDQAGSGDELNLQSYKCKIAPVNFAKNAKPQSSMVLIKNDEIDFESLTGRAVSVNEGAGREVVGVKKESATLKITFQDSAAIADFYNGEAQKRGVVVTLAGATSVLRGSGRGCAIV